MLLVNLI